ncbi:MAG TPA: hypothetical protein VD886_17800 [Herpetosiphonaceae bacterium]|nr:hypothetical protein [Herpetosiphonaceae bacterium]
MRKIATFLLAAALLAGCGTAETSPTATPATGGQPTAAPAASPTPAVDMAKFDLKPMPIDSVEVQIRESQPPQVAVMVSGTLSDKCTFFHEATQVRNGNTIEVTVTTMREKDAMCAQMIEFSTQTIALEGDFPPGDYTVLVNGVEQKFKI